MLYSEKAINKNFQEEVEIEVKLICSERAQVSLRSKEEIDRIKNMHSNE